LLREAFGEESLSRTVVLNVIQVSMPVEYWLKITNIQGDPTPAKQQKMLNKFENLSMKSISK
jgi:hypothetical protein